VRGEAVETTVFAPAAIGPDAATAPLPLSASLRHGATTLSAKGTLGPLGKLDGIDVAVSAQGDALEDIAKLARLPLPDSPPYQVTARLRGGLERWDISDLRMKFGESTFAGTASLAAGAPPRLDASLVSESLNVGDLRTLFGAPPEPAQRASPRQQREAEALAAKDKAVPEKPFDTESWKRLDAHLRFEARRVLKSPVVPVDALAFEATLDKGVLRVDPLRLAIAGGEVSGSARLDSRESPLAAEAGLALNGLRLDRLFPATGDMAASKGALHGRAAIKARGNSATALLASADGRLSLTLAGGQVSNLVLEAAGLDAAEALRLFASGDKPIRVRCMVADFDIGKGSASSRALVFDTEDTLLVGEGSIDLGRERVDLTTYPQPKDASPLVFRAPLHVRGPFRDLSVRPDIPTLAGRGGAALLLGLVNPLLALAPLIETGPGRDSDCAGLLQQARGWNPDEETSSAKAARAVAGDASASGGSSARAPDSKRAKAATAPAR
jgi:uncharacterized protein involved in outer membrane biogenesis